MPVICDAVFNVAVILPLHHAERRDQEPSVLALQPEPVSVNGVIQRLRGIAHEVVNSRTIIGNERVIVVRAHDVCRGGLTVADLNACIVYDPERRDVVARQQHHVPVRHGVHEFVQLR